jgi:hypothetical protein
VGDFESMDGPVSVKEEHLEKICTAYNGKLAKLKRLVIGQLSVGNLPPIQLDHNRSARDTVGRLENSNLTIEDWTDEDGRTRKALYGNVRFLGRENVEKVLDGRWSTLSIGANFDDGKLDELSVTPFPAAEKASILASGGWSGNFSVKGKNYSWEKQSSSGLLWLYDEEFNVIGRGYKSVADARKAAERHSSGSSLSNTNQPHSSIINKDSIMKLALYQRLRKYFKLKKKMSDEEIDEKMNKLAEEENEEELKKLAEEAEKDEDKKEMSDDDDEEKKKLAEEEEKKKEEMKKKMSAARESLTKLSADFRAKKESAELSAKAAAIGSRLSAIRASGRITPAEAKKIDVKHLASKSQEAIDAVLKSYEDRQPVILVGQLGSMKPMSLKDMETASKQIRMSQLEIETRKNMSLLKNTINETSDKRLSETTVQSHDDSDPSTDKAAMESDYMELCRLMDEGKVSDAKSRLKNLMIRLQSMGAYGMAEPTMHEESMKQLAGLSKDIEALTSKFNDAVQLAESLAGGNE